MTMWEFLLCFLLVAALDTAWGNASESWQRGDRVGTTIWLFSVAGLAFAFWYVLLEVRP